VGIPTAGRPEVVRATIGRLGDQSRKPDLVVVCGASEVDIADVRLCGLMGATIRSARGLTIQRNALLAYCRDFDVLVFFDDDFWPSARYLEAIEQCYRANDDIVMITGRVLADGIKGPGLSIREAQTLLESWSSANAGEDRKTDVYNGYGCNMAIRLSSMQGFSIEFDKKLPLYGWLEDVDFSRRVAALGRIVRLEAACGVHLGVKSGRQSGVCLGYSQLANPFYLARKGTMTAGRAVRQVAKNVCMNLACSFRPEPFVDRRGRLWGNVLALADFIAGRLDPMRALALAGTGIRGQSGIARLGAGRDR
jgi:hypothetical protein